MRRELGMLFVTFSIPTQLRDSTMKRNFGKEEILQQQVYGQKQLQNLRTTIMHQNIHIYD